MHKSTIRIISIITNSYNMKTALYTTSVISSDFLEIDGQPELPRSIAAIVKTQRMVNVCWLRSDQGNEQCCEYIQQPVRLVGKSWSCISLQSCRIISIITNNSLPRIEWMSNVCRLRSDKERKSVANIYCNLFLSLVNRGHAKVYNQNSFYRTNN